MGPRRRGRQARTSWQEIPRQNDSWEEFYKQQNMPAESEFEEFKATCQRDLPLTFRITGTTKHAVDIRNLMETRYIEGLKGIKWDGKDLPIPSPLAFYPDELAWQVDVSKQVIRKNPEFSQFQRFLVVETAVGNISRQEAVSMIPPLLLDVQPHHSVLDTCASPGSKTVQLIESLHRDGARPSGFVIANDADYKRSHMLTHQVKRLNSANVLITNHDAQLFPKIKLGENQYLKFDRILCDVPCSGDATMRKNVNVWRDWTVGNGLGLHQLQLNITLRGVQMLKQGGRLVYSTCSLNPVEDEAVLAQVLRKHPEMKLVDVSNKLPGLKRSPGVSTWKVQAKDKTWQSMADTALSRSLFPPTEQEAERFHLERSIRVYPQQQDTGGFFIAVLEKDLPEGSESKRQKVEDAPTETDDSSAHAKPVAVTGDGTASVQAPLKKPPRDALEEPFHFLNPDHPVVQSIWVFYEISNFPRDTLVVRNQTGEPVRTIYYVSPAIKPILQLNEKNLKVIHSGIKLFVQQKNEGQCKWRVQSEGIAMVYPSVGPARVVKTQQQDILRYLCEESFPTFDQLKEQNQELYNQVMARSEGCCFLEVDGNVYPLWRGRASVNIMLSKEYVEELLLRLFNITKVKKQPPTIRAKDETPQTESEQQSVNPEQAEPAVQEETAAAP